jgi:hypothetical protein
MWTMRTQRRARQARIALALATTLASASCESPATSPVTPARSSNDGVRVFSASRPDTYLEETGRGAAAASGLENAPPQAVFKIRPAPVDGQITGAAPLEVEFNACRSEDPDGDVLLFAIDADGDGRDDERGTHGGNCRLTFTYNAGRGETRSVAPRVCVVDLDGNGAPRREPECRRYSIAALGPPTSPAACPMTNARVWIAVGSVLGSQGDCVCPTDGETVHFIGRFPGDTSTFGHRCIAAGFRFGTFEGTNGFCYCNP